MTTLRQFRLPDLGEGLTESDVVSWFVATGDHVELNQVIAEVETAKALVDLPSPFAGTVAALHAEPGQTVGVGDPLVTFEVADDAPDVPDPDDTAAADAADAADHGPRGAAADAATGGADAETAAAPRDDDVPPPNLVGYGAGPQREGRPSRRPRRAPDSGPGTVAAAQGAVPGVGERAPSVESAPSGDRSSAAPTAERPRATPPVRAFAKRLGIDLATVPGTGPGGLVTHADVQAAGGRPAVARPAPTAPAPTATGTAPPTAGEVRIPVRGVHRHTAAAMVASAFTAPQASVFLTVDVTASMDLLARLRSHPLARGTRVTVLALVAHALCAVLASHPALTGRWEEAADGTATIVRRSRVNLGVAVATDRGLVVPHVPDAGSLSLTGMATAVAQLTATARAGRTVPERLTGGTITITNVGVFGVDAGTPILNPGEAAILGMGAVRRRPWEHDGEVALREAMTLCLTFDHRVLDGEQAARFLADLGEVLADPALALLGRPATGTAEAP